MSKELLQQALAYLRWTAFGECRTPGLDGPPTTASELESALAAAIAQPVQPYRISRDEYVDRSFAVGLPTATEEYLAQSVQPALVQIVECWICRNHPGGSQQTTWSEASAKEWAREGYEVVGLGEISKLETNEYMKNLRAFLKIAPLWVEANGEQVEAEDSTQSVQPAKEVLALAKQCGVFEVISSPYRVPHIREQAVLNFADALRAQPIQVAHGIITGHPPGMLQDDSKGLSKWLSEKPDALQHVKGQSVQPAPAARVPMTEDQIINIVIKCEKDWNKVAAQSNQWKDLYWEEYAVVICRAIEAFHGIGNKP